MINQLSTIPASRDVSRDSIDTWAIDFTNALQVGETISTGSAELVTAMPGNDGTVVAGFVTDAVVNDSAINVAWTGIVLTKWSTYRLETKATLNTGAVIELLTTVRCVS